MEWWASIRHFFSLKPVSQHELAGIQYIRAAAAIMVVIDHVGAMANEHKYFGHHPFGNVLSAGSVGVDLFFCLSGFIIVYIALDTDWAPTMEAWTFFKRRFARIVPFMWLVIVSYALLRVAARGHFPAASYARAFVLFPVGIVEPNVVWTLRHELLFYLVFGLTFLRRHKWLFAIWVFSPLALLTFGPDKAPDSISWRNFAEFLFSNVNILFGMGVLLGMAHARRRNTWPSGRWAEPLLVIVLASLFYLANRLNYDRTNLWQVPLVGGLSCAGLAVGCAVGPVRGPLGSISNRLGDASYCIYLTHTAIISAVLGLLSRHEPHASDAVIITSGVLSAVVGGLGLHYLVERRIVAWSQRALFPRRIEGR